MKGPFKEVIMPYVIKHEIGTFYYEERGVGEWTLDETKAKCFARESDAKAKIDGKLVKNFLLKLKEKDSIKIREI